MELGYDGKLYILAFDHRGSFMKAVVGKSDGLTGRSGHSQIMAGPRRIPKYRGKCVLRAIAGAFDRMPRRNRPPRQSAER